MDALPPEDVRDLVVNVRVVPPASIVIVDCGGLERQSTVSIRLLHVALAKQHSEGEL
jgi:hypothetical protein